MQYEVESSVITVRLFSIALCTDMLAISFLPQMSLDTQFHTGKVIDLVD